MKRNIIKGLLETAPVLQIICILKCLLWPKRQVDQTGEGALAEGAEERGSMQRGNSGRLPGSELFNSLWKKCKRQHNTGKLQEEKKPLDIGMPPLPFLCNINISEEVAAALETRLSSAPEDKIRFLQEADGHRISATKPGNFTKEASINTKHLKQRDAFLVSCILLHSVLKSHWKKIAWLSILKLHFTKCYPASDILARKNSKLLVFPVAPKITTAILSVPCYPKSRLMELPNHCDHSSRALPCGTMAQILWTVWLIYSTSTKPAHSKAPAFHGSIGQVPSNRTSSRDLAWKLQRGRACSHETAVPWYGAAFHLSKALRPEVTLRSPTEHLCSREAAGKEDPGPAPS